MCGAPIAGAVLLAAALSLPPEAAVAQALPIDSAQAVQVLREAIASFAESSDAMRGNDRFRRYLDELTEAWGVAWDPESVARPPPPEVVIDSLVARGEISLALAYTPPGPGYWHSRRTPRMVFGALAAQGRAGEALALADSIGLTTLGTYAVLDTTTPDSLGWRWKVDQVERFIRTELTDAASAGDQWGVLNYYLAEHDFAEAWSRAGAWEPDSVLSWRVDILDLAYDQDLSAADSLFLDTYEQARRIDEADVRDPLLADLEELCDWKEISVCDDLEFPARQPDRSRSLRYELERAYREGRLAEAEELGSELRDLVPPVEHALIVSRGLAKAAWPCVHLARCGRTYDSLLAASLPELDRIASKSAGPLADSLNVRLAALWAARDLVRARTALDRIESPEAWSRGLEAFATSAYGWNREAALQAWRERGSAGQNRLTQDFLYFMQWADTARAEEALALTPGGWGRMNARLEWAERVRNAGRWQEARQLAVAALDEWDPSAEPMIGWRGQFNVFWRTGTYDDAIAWGRALPDPDDRAAALAALVGTLPRPRERN